MREGVQVCIVLLRAKEIMCNFAPWNKNTESYVQVQYCNR